MKSDLVVPPPLRAVAETIDQAGGRAWLVGGSIRDHLMGRSVKDWDVEVHGVEMDVLERLLRKHGSVNAVGRSFGVFKLRARGMPASDPEIDVSIPRRDSNVGPGHKGIAVEGDPNMSLEEAVRRRDLTINALMLDLHTGEIADPSGGLDDLEHGALRPVDPSTFLEDPLRALRVVQFVARTGFTPTADLLELCRRAPLDELAAERIQAEWEKLLLKGTAIAAGLQVARETGVLARVFPEHLDDPALDAALDRAIPRRDGFEGAGQRWSLMLGIWLYSDDRDRTESTLDRLWLHKVGGFNVRHQVLVAADHRDDPLKTDAHLRHRSVAGALALAIGIRESACQVELTETWDRAEALGLLWSKPAPLLQGRDLGPLGLQPGPAMGKLLKSAYLAQLDGELQTHEQALEWARTRS